METRRNRATAEQVRDLRDTLSQFDTAILVSHGTSGELNARPMVITDVSEEGELWFVTNEDTPKVVELRQDGRVLAIMQAPRTQATVSGHARLERDIHAFASRLGARARQWLDDSRGAPIAIVLEPLTAELWDVEVGSDEIDATRRASPATRTEHTIISFAPVR